MAQRLERAQRAKLTDFQNAQVLGNFDLLRVIFVHLPPSDRQTVTLVNREWNHVANSLPTWKTLHFTDPTMNASDIAGVCATYPHIVQVKVNGLETRLGIQLARHSALSHLQSLSLRRMPLMYGPPLVLDSFPNLLSLHLDCPFMANAAALDLPSLEKLVLQGMYLTDFKCPKLLELDVKRSWRWDEDLRLLSQLRSLRIVSCTTADPRWRHMKLDRVLSLFIENWAVDFLGLHCPLATTCEFGGFGGWMRLRLDAPKAKKLVVYTKGCLKACFDCPSLEWLDVGEVASLEDEFWMSLPEKSPMTSHVVSRGECGINGVMTRALARLKSLTRLTVHSVSLIPCALKCGRVEVLQIENCNNWWVALQEDVDVWTRNFPKLRKIRIVGTRVDASIHKMLRVRWPKFRIAYLHTCEDSSIKHPQVL